jgi:hypothetical protein
VAHLLLRAGIAVACDRALLPRRAVPAIMLSDMALALLRDVFGRPTLFADRHRITRRVVRWGQAEPVTMPHGAVVVSEDDLVAEFGRGLGGPPEVAPAPGTAAVVDGYPHFAVHSAPPFPQPVQPGAPANVLRCFGSRRALAMPVGLAPGVDAACCQVEAVPQGWLFLVPSGPEQCWLLAIGGPADELLAQSRLVAPQLAWRGEAAGSFETAPRLLEQLAGPGWLACGMAAIAFDPICGDGTAQAVREAILAAAVIEAVHAGGSERELASHYEAMLIASLRRHLQLSGQFYARGGGSDWWREQLAAVAEGYDWCTQRLSTTPEPRFALRGYRLVSLADAR